jgi:hypothetical protein
VVALIGVIRDSWELGTSDVNDGPGLKKRDPKIKRVG